MRGAAFYGNGTLLLTVADDKSMKVWNLSSGRCVKSIEAHSHFVSCIAVSGGLVGTGSVDEEVKIWGA